MKPGYLPILICVRFFCGYAGAGRRSAPGDVASVQASVAAGRAVIAEAGELVNAVVISRPHPDVYREVV